jgi:N-acetylglucosamine malate deacetylase 1
MTDGRYAFHLVFGKDFKLTPMQVKELRHEESTKAIKVLGVPEENIIFLDFEDQKLGKNEKSAELIVTEVLADYCPDEILMPYKNDLHCDHKGTYRIVTRSMRVLGLKKLVFQFANLQKYYNPRYNGLDFLANLFRHRLVDIDISDVLAIKKRAMGEYKFLYNLLFPTQTRPLMLHSERYLQPKETFLTENIS